MKKYGQIFFDMKILLQSLVLFLFFIVCSCSRIDELEHSGVYEIIVTATSETHEPGTRTMRQSNGAVYWTPGDVISLFYNSGTMGGSKFTSQGDRVE